MHLSLALLHRVLDGANIGVTVWVLPEGSGPRGLALIAGDAVAERLLGRALVPGAPISELLPELWGALAPACVDAIAGGRDASLGDLRACSRWVHARAVALGEGRVAVTLEDVTARREAEDAVRREAEASADEAARYRAVFDVADEAIVTTDARGRVDQANPSACRMFGWRADELRGCDVGTLLQATGGERRAFGASRDATGVRRDDTTFPVRLHVTETNTDGTRRYVKFVRDVSREAALQEQLAARAEALARSNRELERFAYVASHDLQEPLRMVSAYTELLSRRYSGQLDATADRYIHFAVDGARRMQALIRDLLTYSRAEAWPSSPVPIDVRDLVESVCTDLAVSLQETGGRITASALPTVIGDPTQLRQLFQNLLTNGLKFRRDLPPVVAVSAEGDGVEWTFTVKDNGIGVPTEHAARVFDAFVRLHAQDKYPGTGVGLAICKKVVERHGGRIWLESGAPGATFRFTLPVDPRRPKRPAQSPAT